MKHVQRGILLRLLHEHFDLGFVEPGPDGRMAQKWILWGAERFAKHIDWPKPSATATKSTALSRGLAELERLRLVSVQRHDGGRAERVRLTPSGTDVAFEIAEYGWTASMERDRLRSMIPPRLRKTRTEVHRELRRGSPDNDRGDLLRAYASRYDQLLRRPLDSDDILELERLQALLASSLER